MIRKILEIVVVMALVTGIAACGTLHTMDLGATRNGAHSLSVAHASVTQLGLEIQQT